MTREKLAVWVRKEVNRLDAGDGLPHPAYFYLSEILKLLEVDARQIDDMLTARVERARRDDAAEISSLLTMLGIEKAKNEADAAWRKEHESELRDYDKLNRIIDRKTAAAYRLRDAYRAKLSKLSERMSVLVRALQTICAWLVCWPITSASDMAQSFEKMRSIAEAALAGDAPTRDDPDLFSWASAVVTALAVGDIKQGSKLHHKLRDTVIAARSARGGDR